MSLFGRKPEPLAANQPPPTQNDEPHAPLPVRSYGVADLIRLLKTIPVDQHPDLVVRVVKTTLESVGVQSSQVIEDAERHEASINERVVTLEDEIEGLTAQIHVRREQIAQLNVELAETTNAKHRLLGTEGLGGPQASADMKPRSLPPPMPPPFHKSASGKPPEPTTSS